MSAQQSLLPDDRFETLRPAHQLYCHEEFLEKLDRYRTQPMGKRAALLMQRLAINSDRLHYKSTQGENQGWRRSRLGGAGGSHYYAWWAPRGAAPLRLGTGFDESPDGSVFLRDIRHHDDHSPAQAHTLLGHYLPVSVPEIRREDYSPSPWTSHQSKFASARQVVRVLKGHPGTGKTTALLHAADACDARRVLYLTYSRELAVLASEFFERYCSSTRQFQVLTYDAFLRQLLKVEREKTDSAEWRSRFRSEVMPHSRALGPWSERLTALYDEFHAHLVGSALPVESGRFAKTKSPRCDDRSYRSRRSRFVGEHGVSAVLDVASRLERGGAAIADRFFPELALAWQAAEALLEPRASRVSAGFLEFDCVAVDECQDLTPIEASVIVELVAATGRINRLATRVFFAGDEAQTVRPTDFEWAWMNDMLHSRLATPGEFKLATNLRSPRTIAMLVNRVWDLYGEIGKRDRPSGSGYAEIDDDATDQILYCTAKPGEELENCLLQLAAREGLVMVTYDEQVCQRFPESVQKAVLTPAEVKGLDFHTVCLINAGAHLDRIVGLRRDYLYDLNNMDSLRQRLAIDELRVGVSRPADRLIWLDIAPQAATVQRSVGLLNVPGENSVAPCIPSALLTALAEEQLDLEERIQRCQKDARQFLDARPEMAWSRAQQAVTLLGGLDNPHAVQDPSLRRSVFDTLAEICFCLGMRRTRLPVELGQRDMFHEAAAAAQGTVAPALIARIGAAMQADQQGRLNAIGHVADYMGRHGSEIEPWVLAEVAAKAPAWISELEASLPFGDNAVLLSESMPGFFKALRLPDAAERSERLLERCLRHLLKNKKHAVALELLRREFADRKRDIEAECLEALGSFIEAASVYRAIDKPVEALRCYRAAPDFEAAAALIGETPNHPAAEAYEWLLSLKAVLARRPSNFQKVMTTAEKKILEQMLEQGLGVSRAPKAPRKTAARKTAKKAAVKRPSDRGR